MHRMICVALLAFSLLACNPPRYLPESRIPVLENLMVTGMWQKLSPYEKEKLFELFSVPALGAYCGCAQDDGTNER